MSSLKDFEKYKALIITLDDLIFNINELRYDFSLLLYPKTFNQFSYQDYTRRLGTVESMYSFVQPQMIASVNEKIENYIYDGKNLHNILLKESADALLSFAKSKQLKVIVLTTHNATNAKQLLAYRRLLQDVDQVISISELCKDTPSIKLFHALAKLHHISIEELLVVSSIANVFKCLQYSPIDTIFVPDNKNSYFDVSLYPTATMSTLFDVLQFALFGKYTSTDLYRDFLGYDEGMNEQEKRKRYSYLKMKYENHPEILPILDEVFTTEKQVNLGEMTQEFHQAFHDIEKKFNQMDFQTEAEKSATLLSFEKIRAQEKESTSKSTKIEEVPSPIVELEPVVAVEVDKEIPNPSEELQREIEDEIKKEFADTEEGKLVFDQTQEFSLEQLDKTEELEKEIEEEIKKEFADVDEEKLVFDQTQEFSLEQLDKTVEFSPIEHPIEFPKDNKIGEIFDEIEDTQEEATMLSEELEVDADEFIDEDDKMSALDIFLSGILNFLTAIMIVSIGGLIHMCFYSMVADITLLKALFDIVFVGFSSVCVAIYEFIVQPFPAISINNVTTISPLFLEYIILIVTVFLVICLYKGLIYLRRHQEYYGEM